MKKIGIDARLYSQTGVGVYIRNLIYYLQKLSHKNIYFYIYLMTDDFSKVSFTNKNFIKKEANFKWHSISEQIGLLQQLNQDDLDLVHFTYFGYPAFYRKKFIATIHDLTPLFFRTGKSSTKNIFKYSMKSLAFRFVVQSQVKNSKYLITPTETVKRQINEIFGSSYSNKIIPIYEGINHELLNTKENEIMKKKFPKDFLLYVGNFYPHKNVERLIEAFSRIQNQMQLVLVGPNDYFANRITQSINRLKQSGRIVLYTNPTMEDFVFFYKRAFGLVHPSLSEGFGLPLVEAMHFKLPIIASNIPVFKEILANRYISFNPNYTNDITQKMEQFVKQPKQFDYTNLLKRYSFEEMAKKTVEVYEKALKM